MRRLRYAPIVAGVALAAVPAAWFVRLIVATPPLIVLGAAAPAVCWVGLILLLDRREREPLRALLTMFLWGAVIAAFLSSFANDQLLAWVGGITGEEWGRLLISTVAGPVVEETAKAAALVGLLVVWRAEFGGILDGIVYGALVGMGFAMTENITYFTLATLQSGRPGLVRAIYLRALLGGVNHAAFTATFGASLGWSREHGWRAWRFVPSVGFLGVVLQHLAWNAVASDRITQILCNPETVGGVCRDAPDRVDLLVTVPLLVALCLGPGVVALAVLVTLARRAPRRSPVGG